MPASGRASSRVFVVLVWLLLVATACVAAQKGATAKLSPSDVLVLTHENFSIIEKGLSSERWMIEFYAPWCAHCKKLAPVYQDLAGAADSEKYRAQKVKLAKMDCSDKDNQGVCRRFNVRGFPTLMMITGGKLYEFEGDRTLEELVRFTLQGGWESVTGFRLPQEDDHAWVKYFYFLERDLWKRDKFYFWYLVYAVAGCVGIALVLLLVLVVLLVRAGASKNEEAKQPTEKKQKAE